MENKNRLWYKTPAKEWIAALPLGNGRMGAMVYGGVREETIQIDENTFWSGAASTEANNRPGTRELMEKIREALLKEDYEEADRLGHGFVGDKNQYGTNMPVGELKLQIAGAEEALAEGYERSLSLRDSVARTVFALNGKKYERECFVSNPAQVFLLRMTAEECFDAELRYEGIGNNTGIAGWEQDTAIIRGDALETLHSDGRHGVHLEGRMKLRTDGRLSFEAGAVRVEEAGWLELFLNLETTMFLEEPGTLAKDRVEHAAARGYQACRDAHLADVRPLFDRMDIELGEEEKRERPTDVRIHRAAAGEEDLELYALMYQYGRYLLIASSREDSLLPTHMGGIWNDNIYNNIDCTQDMHIDMNLQMQYWAAGLVSLPECYQPFFRYMEQVLIPSGERTAREAYHADGWTAHVVSNPWGFTSLGWAYNWGAWSLGGAWCSVMVWDYFTCTRDVEFLKQKGFFMLEGAARFVLDYVFWDETSGYYMTGPSYSPENQFSYNGKNYFLSLSNTCDVILVRETLECYQKAARLLGEESRPDRKALLERAEQVLEHLPPYQLGKHGQIQEWFYDFEEPIPNHRHTSHLLGLYPFRQITAEDEKLAEGARETIRRRCEDFEITSWGMNMLMGYCARLRDGAGALKLIRWTFRKIVRDNLASVMDDEKSMWKGTWELDGNTGFTAAVSEMLIQSSEREISLLPALPETWKAGRLTGITMANGGKADLFWEDGKLTKACLCFKEEGRYRISYGKARTERVVQAGETLEISGGKAWFG